MSWDWGYMLNLKSKKSYDWLQDALKSVCQNAFQVDPSLQVHSIEPRQNRSFPHLEYQFVLEASDTQLRLVLRLYQGLFSLWGGTDNLKASKEYSVLRHVYQYGYPSPFPYCFSPSLKPFGYPYIILDPGDGFRWWESEESLSYYQERMANALAESLARLHLSIQARHPLIPTVELHTVFSRLWSRVRHLGNDELKNLFKLCGRCIREQYTSTWVLLHGCLDLDHTLLSLEKVRTVVNWEHTAIGDPRWDVAYTALALQRENDRSLSNQLIARYVQLTNNPLTDLGFWEGFIALRNYALCQWVRSLDSKSYPAVIGLQAEILQKEPEFRLCALRQFT